MTHHHGLDGIRDNFPVGQAVTHTGMPLGNAVTHGYRVELNGLAAGFQYSLLYLLSQLF